MNSDSNTETKSPFYALAPKDLKFVINLCEEYTYREALKILARPRPEGLALETSVSNLRRRFFVQWHPLPHKYKIKSQLVEALDEKFFDTGEVYFRAIIALVQQLVFNALKEGASLEQSTSNLRLMLSLRIHYHKHLQMRADFKSPNRLIEDVPDKYLEADSYEKAELPAEPEPQDDIERDQPHPAPAAPSATATASTPPPAPPTEKPQTTPPSVSEIPNKTTPENPTLSWNFRENSTEIPTQIARNFAFSTNSTTEFPPQSGPTPNSK